MVYSLLFYVFILALTFLVFYTANFALEKYFGYAEKRATSLTYPISKALSVLLTAFVIRHGMGEQLLSLGIALIENNTTLDIGGTATSSASLVGDIAFYFCVTIIAVFYSYIAFKKQNEIIVEKIKNAPPLPQIEFPENVYQFQPIFHERIQHLFQLKYEKYKLAFNWDSKFGILYCKYRSCLKLFSHIFEKVAAEG